ncbi:MAG: hypothetical protein HRU06_18995 [Oceanospirillaceae bacterium]|nr:hypothetical protein [Oceanospirillaceae bacterium]
MKSNDYADFLNILTKKVRALSEEDIRRVLLGENELILSVAEKKSANSNKITPVEIDVEKILGSLNEAKDRDTALDLLSSINKTSLEQVARALDIAIQRTDKIDTLRRKIVEYTVGARLRSSAIQGTKT